MGGRAGGGHGRRRFPPCTDGARPLPPPAGPIVAIQAAYCVLFAALSFVCLKYINWQRR